MAPEVYLYEIPYEISADIWSFGVIVYEIAVGEWPFEAKTTQELKSKLKSKFYKFPKDKDVVLELLDLVSQCL